MADRLVDLRDYGPEFVRDPYPFYAELRERGPVHPAVLRDGGDAWLVVGHEEARAALAHPGQLKDWNAASRAWKERELGDPEAAGSAFGRHMLVADPPDHTRLRRLVSKAFTPHRIEALRPRVQQITDDLLDQLPKDGSADLVDAFAYPLPMAVICELLGVPFLDGERFRGWSNRIVAPEEDDPEGNFEAAEQLVGYLNQLIEVKRSRPGDDLLSALIQTTDEGGDRLSADELRAMAFLLLVAGHETTVNLISNGVLALLRHPDQLAALRADFSLLDGAVEEMLRYEGPLEGATARFTRRPVELGGTVIPGGGHQVIIVLASAHRDGGRFPEADTFDIRREPVQHFAFGHGIHFCLGASLARMEGRIAIRSLLERCPELALDGDPADLAWRPGHLIRGVQRLPVTY
jgi:cytochrome P450